jgi:hypothetical protein
MPEKIDKKQSNRVGGYLLITGGIIGVVSRFIGEISWGIISIVQLVIAVLAIFVGLWYVLKKK